MSIQEDGGLMRNTSDPSSGNAMTNAMPLAMNPAAVNLNQSGT
jgi:hypothetical protein